MSKIDDASRPLAEALAASAKAEAAKLLAKHAPPSSSSKPSVESALRLKAGLHRGVRMSDYVADPCPEPSLSASTIRRLVGVSPLKAWQAHPRLGGKPRDPSTASDIGTAAHAMVLEGADVIQVVETVTKADGSEVVPVNWATKDAKARRSEIRAAGKIPLLPHEAPDIYAMAKVAGEAIRNEVGPGEAETTIIWQESNGVWCRARADWLPEGIVTDYKTSKRAEPGEWIRRVLFKSGYDISAAWYLRGLEALGAPRSEYKWFVQETEAPFDYSWVGLDGEALDLAERMVRKAIKVWGECLKSGRWPGYPKHTHYAELPAWHAMSFEESELAELAGREVFGGDS